MPTEMDQEQHQLVPNSCVDSDDNDNDDDDDDDNYDEFDEVKDDNDEDANLSYHPICDPSGASFSSLKEALRQDLDAHGFDLLSVLPSASSDDFYESAIVCINMCRKFVSDNTKDGDVEDIGKRLKAHLDANFSLGNRNANDDGDDDDDSGMEQYYKPVLTDDAFLMTLDDLEDLKMKEEGASDDSGDVIPIMEGTAKTKAAAEELASLQEQLDRAKELIAKLTLEQEGGSDDAKDGTDSETAQKPVQKRDNDTYYFSSYSSHYIHETMLRDTVRTEAYENAIMSNAETLFKGKVVMDIGCGTGVLSIFAAKAGAKKVIAVDGSTIIHDARNIIDLNGFGGKILCCQGMLEKLLENNDLPLDEGEKVDVIVSEWMGYALFFETMLPSVMKARDALMADGGTMYPNAAQIFLEGASDTRLDYWADVHGIDMTPMKSRVAKELVHDAGVEVVDAADIVTDRVELIGFDLNKCKDEELDFSVPFILSARSGGNSEPSGSGTRIDKLVVSFDIDFHVLGTNPISFSTGCQTTPTHWKQATLWFDPVVGIPTLGEGEILRGQFKMGRNAENHRAMDFDVFWETGRLSGENFARNSSGWIVTTLGA